MLDAEAEVKGRTRRGRVCRQNEFLLRFPNSDWDVAFFFLVLLLLFAVFLVVSCRAKKKKCTLHDS